MCCYGPRNSFLAPASKQWLRWKLCTARGGSDGFYVLRSFSQVREYSKSTPWWWKGFKEAGGHGDALWRMRFQIFYQPGHFRATLSDISECWGFAACRGPQMKIKVKKKKKIKQPCCQYLWEKIWVHIAKFIFSSSALRSKVSYQWTKVVIIQTKHTGARECFT